MVNQGHRPTEDALWTAGQVARSLRVSESTLRSWHRRYGVGPHNAQPGRYRRYGADDIARLERMRDLIQAGVLASEAARVIATGEDTPPVATELVQVLAAVHALDTARCLTVLERVLTHAGVVEMWDRVCRPAFAQIDDDQRDGRECIDEEHALSWAVSAALHRVHRRPPGAAAPVLLACTESEQHTLPMEALAAALAERAQLVSMLGAATPTPALIHAVDTAEPATVVLWSQRPDSARLDAVHALGRRTPRLVTAGPGWAATGPPPTVHLSDLTEALALLDRNH